MRWNGIGEVWITEVSGVSAGVRELVWVRYHDVSTNDKFQGKRLTVEDAIAGQCFALLTARKELRMASDIPEHLLRT